MRRQQLQNLIEIPENTVIKHITNIENPKRREIHIAQQLKWEQITIYVNIDLLKGEIQMAH
jgi:hypothetical protein